jgi:hypothetical protein
MSKEAERQFLVSKVLARRSDFDFPFSVPNQNFNIPKNSPYGEFHIVAGGKSIIRAGHGKGKARIEYVGYVQMNVWMPKDSGTKIGTEAEDLFREIFQLKVGRDDAHAVYEFKTIESYTPTTKQGWEVASYRVPYTRTIIESVQVSI